MHLAILANGTLLYAIFVLGIGALLGLATCAAPLRSRDYSSPPGGELYVVPCGPSSGANFPLNINPPRHTIILTGNDGGGATNGVFLSFQLQPQQGNPPAPTSIGNLRSFHFVGIGGSSVLGLTFRKKIGGTVYLFWSDTGQPGSNYYFQTTDDYLPGGITVPFND